jgi:7-cyano-7-deazaguanine synthase in queuosine biosynthesis
MTPYSFAFRRAGDSEATVLTAGEQFRFDINRYEQFFSEPLPPRLIDLLRVAAAIYVADRLVRRKQRDQRRFWSRSLVLKTGVLDPGFWNDGSVLDALTDAVQFLSDDTWEFSFEKDDRRPANEVQRVLFGIPSDARVCLYSGGLDSAAGLAVRIAAEPAKHVLPVTVWHQPIQRKLVQRQFDFLTSRYGVPVSPLIAKAALIWTPELKRFREEGSQRCRAFLFTAAGAAAAAMAGGSQVEIYESGIGAVNLPLMAGMVGSRTTRSVHPEFLKRMSDLVSLVCDRSIKFDVPFVTRTKGQVARELSGHGLGGLARMTVSCVHYPLREQGHKQCGICPACIFRRQALSVAGTDEAEDTYKFDLFGSSESANSVPAKHRKYLRAFLGQVVGLDEVRPDAPLPARFRRHLIGTGVLTLEQSAVPVARLLSAYRDEWRRFIEQAETRGISWTRLVASSTPALEGAARATV